MKHSILNPTPLMVAVALMTMLVATALLTPSVRADRETFVYLPLIGKQRSGGTSLPPPSGTPAEIARDRINFYRSLAGVQPVQLHPALTQAAQNHAQYTLLNYAEPTAWDNGPHGEVAGKPGYTGRTAGERAIAAGFPYAAGWELKGSLDNPSYSVDGFMGTVFHRVGIILPTHSYVGYGHGTGDDGMSAVDVLNFGKGVMDLAGEPRVVVYPANQQTDVRLFGSSETPSYLPPGAQYPAGYPITIQPLYGSVLSISEAEPRDEHGVLVHVYPSPASCGTTCYAILPTAGLQPTTTYTAHVAGTVDGVAFAITWSFTTRAW